MKVLVFLSLLLCVAQARVYVQKKVTSDYFAQERNATLLVNVYNLGDSSVYDVNVTDDWPVEKFDLFGIDSAHWDEIPAGQNVSYTYSVVPKIEGFYNHNPILIRYRTAPDAPATTGFSNPLNFVWVLTPEEYERATAKFYKQWTIFGLGTALSVIAPLLAWLKFQYSFENGLPKN
eukprot:TRINITY_DN1310_c0_g1_i1.p2 TRINITY_DN1310_c0_g1~~TRINITY_DN1310_c0_g1_i1.p2  ORF type:complete len:176 (+),score=67.32 TRINITY_DN1310_c0_g1_i1:81-608(+)